MKKFEPHYRLVRYGQATKIEKASRQQRTLYPENEMDYRRLRYHVVAGLMEYGLTILQQASRGRTAPRSSGVPRSPRVRARTRRNKRLHLWVVVAMGGACGQQRVATMAIIVA